MPAINLLLLKQKFHLTLAITKAQMKSRYRKTLAGFFWVILNPILTFLIQAIIFKNVLRMNIQNYYLFLLSGIIPWIFLTMSLQMTVGNFINHRQSLLAFKIDGWIFILAQIIDNFINFVITFILLLCFFIPKSLINFQTLPLIAITSIIMFIMVFLISFILAILHVFFRDTQFILQFVLNLAYFATPIFYPESSITTKYGNLMILNPLYTIIRPFHSLIWKNNINEFTSYTIDQIVLLVILTLITFAIWGKNRNEIYNRI